MYLEQETASIIKFVLDHTDNPYPYYESIPESFVVPAAYFPSPEVMSDGETLRTYGLDYAVYVKFFAKTSNGAFELAHKAVEEIRKARNLIPLIGNDGTEIEGEGIRINDPDLRVIDEGVAQAVISWRSRRPYNREDSAAVEEYTFNINGAEYSITNQNPNDQGTPEEVDPKE